MSQSTSTTVIRLLLAAALAAALVVKPAWAFAAGGEPRLRDLVVANSSRDLLMYLRLEDALSDEIVAGVKNGIAATFVFEIELDLVRDNWPDKEVFSGRVEHTLSYDNLKDSFAVRLSEKGVVSAGGRTLEEAKALMCEINGFAVVPLAVLEPDKEYVLRVRAELAKKGLPFYFDYLIPFGGIGGFATDWAEIRFRF